MTSPAPLRRVLVIDDDYAHAEYLRVILSSAGWNVSLCMDPLEATEAVCRENPEVILLDYVMPNMNGMELAAWLKDKPESRRIPLVMCSINMDRKLAQEAAALGVNRALTKPINKADLLDCLRDVLAEHQQNQHA
jgi:CheY-like chemotaxis protein